MGGTGGTGGTGTAGETPGTPGAPGTPGTPGTPVSPAAPQVASTVVIIDASGKDLGPRYARAFSERGLALGQVSSTSQLSPTTQIIIYRPDAASLQKVMSVLPNAKLIIQTAAPGDEHQITVLLGSDLGL